MRRKKLVLIDFVLSINHPELSSRRGKSPSDLSVRRESCGYLTHATSDFCFPMVNLWHNFLACFTKFAMVSFNCKHLYSHLSTWILTKATTVKAIFLSRRRGQMTMAKKISVRQVTKNCSYRCITKRCHVFHRPRPVRIE